MSAAVTTIGLTHMTNKVAYRRFEIDQDKKLRALGLDDSINLSIPQVSSSLRREMPKGLKASDIFVKVTVTLSKAGHERGDDEELAAKIAQDLKGHCFNSTSFAKSESNAKLVMDIVITDASTGSRWDRCWKNDLGFVRMGLKFSMYDPSEEACPIIKMGKIVYVDPLKDNKFKQRCGKNSGERALQKVLPVISRQLINAINLDVSMGNPDLA
ncbi:expressed unknown protein [Seminavis robusta]|uniref:Uncharacterized protein n=1 Tax=Seminavis robusta TaxID=568900 RepID=A0A9N8DSW6_9STRA|nr:expressed unknown protein [Seminavis robusta]|eukprot:Sro257_g100940.1 n/a (213) ;mRNA; f:68121-68759